MKYLITITLFLIFSHSTSAQTITQPTDKSPNVLKSKIYYGIPVDPTNTPTVQLTINTSNGAFSCSGTLIARRKILTAAHCLTGGNVNSIAVLFPNIDLISASSFVASPSYDPVTKTNDVAIITLSRNAPAQIRPAAISPRKPKKDSILLVYGYGYDENGNIGQFKGAAMITSSYDVNKIYAFGGSTNAFGSACQGDSGGPAFTEYKSGRKQKFGIVGITSTVGESCFSLITTFTSVFSPKVSPFIRKYGR